MFEFNNSKNVNQKEVVYPPPLSYFISHPRECVHLFRQGNKIVAFPDLNATPPLGDWVGTLPGISPEWICGRSFVQSHHLRYPYVVGAMANAITSTQMVIACANEGILCFFGSAGLDEKTIATSLAHIRMHVPENASWGANLIHAPHEPGLEFATAKRFVDEGVRFVSASAYLKLSEAIVFAAFSGIHQDSLGGIVRARSIFAKISRPETASAFMLPPSAKLLTRLLDAGHLNEEECRLAAQCSVATDIIVESDSGGHTDNQALGALFPRIAELREELQADVRLGAAGGLGSPRSLAAAIALGADFLLTGTVNQTTIESGLSVYGKALLAKADIGDVMMAPAADMFEMGVKLQVLKRGTMFGVRAQRLWEAYEKYKNFEVMPDELRRKLEDDIFGQSVDDIWKDCQAFFAERDPLQLEKAAASGRHKMALVFRWYLGKSSRWANAGKSERKLDFQIWCGPAIAAFNSWVEGSFLEDPNQRGVVQLAKNLLEGATRLTRANQLRQFGLSPTQKDWNYRPRPLEECS